MLEYPSLERYYPKDDEEFGLKASNISDDAARRHVRRYRTVIEMLADVVRPDDSIFDVGSGSGYGTNMLSAEFRYVTGIEPNTVALKYARKHYPNTRFANYQKTEDVVVMVESMEHMTPQEFKEYVSDEVRVLLVTTPLLANHNNAFHVNEFSRQDQAISFIQRFGFQPISSRIDYGIRFTTGDLGDQFFGLFGRLDQDGSLRRR